MLTFVGKDELASVGVVTPERALALAGETESIHGKSRASQSGEILVILKRTDRSETFAFHRCGCALYVAKIRGN